MKKRQIQIGMLAGGLSAGGALVYNFSPATHGFYPRCPFYAVTHLLCPGCGGTRAVYEMLHLNLSEAWRYNALVTLLTPLVLMWLGWSCYQALRYDRLPDVPWPRTVAASLVLIAFLFAVIRDTGLAFAI